MLIRRHRGSALRSLVIFAAIVLVVFMVISEFLADTAPEAPAEFTAEPALPQSTMPYALSAQRSDWPPLDQDAPAAGQDISAVNYYVVLDGSGSMRRSQCSGDISKMDAALSALSNFVETVPPAANLGLAVFDGRGLSEHVPLAKENRESFQQQLSQVNAKGGTPLRSGIELGYQKLTAQARQQLGYGEYHLVVVTDGHPDPESEDPTGIVNQLLNSSPVVLHTIGFCIGEQHALNQPGRVFYLAADNPAQLKQGLDSVLAEAPSFDVTTFGQ